MPAYGNMDVAVSGLIYGVDDRTTNTKIAVGTIPYGRAVWQVIGNETQAKAYDGVATVFAGISLFDQKTTLGYVDKESVNVLNIGKCWVEVDGNVTAGSPAFFDTVTGKFKASGKAIPSVVFFTNSNSGFAVVAVLGQSIVAWA